MKNEKIKSEFEAWLKLEKGIDVNSHSLYQAALTDSVEEFLNSKYNGVSFIEHYPKEEHNPIILDTWKHTVQLMLKSTDSSITYKNVKLSDYHEIKDQLLNQLQNIES